MVKEKKKERKKEKNSGKVNLLPYLYVFPPCFLSKFFKFFFKRQLLQLFLPKKEIVKHNLPLGS